MIRRRSQEAQERRAAKVAAKASKVDKPATVAVEPLAEVAEEGVADETILTSGEFCEWARISKATLYRLLDRGELQARFIGRTLVVARTEAKRWFDALPAQSPHKTKPSRRRAA